jgi:hypothetical protein
MFLLNIPTGSRYSLALEQWRNLLETAKEAGWEPQGSILDLAFQLFVHPDPNYLFESQLFVTLYLHHYCLNWNGDYASPEYQLVCDDDARNFLHALECTGAEGTLLQFISLGSFRICPE